MKNLTWSFIVALIIITSCTDNDDTVLGDRLFETNYALGYSHLQYVYTNDRIEKIIQFNDMGVSAYLKVNYQDITNPQIKSINYYPEHPTFQQYDTLLYTGNNLTRIIKTTFENGELTSRDTTNFLYDEANRLIEATRQIRTVLFSNFEEGNFGQVKYFNYENLTYLITIKYDNKISPFKDLGYLNLVFFNHFNLEGLPYLTSKNIIELTEYDYQPTTLILTYIMNYKYDKLDRPISVTKTLKEDNEYKVKEFYKYR